MKTQIKNQIKNHFVFILFVFIFFVLLLFVFSFLYEKDDTSSSLRTLNDDGYVVIPNATKEKALHFLPHNYVFLDYTYIIEGCSLSTFHRDVTSSQYIFNTQYPTYTFIVYKNAGSLLTVCPSSEKTIPFCFSQPVTIIGEAGTGVLFDCDLLHTGTFNNKDKSRYVEQYKIVHISDLEKMKHLQGIHITKSGNCDISYIYEWLTRKLSLGFPFLFNHVLTPYLQDKQPGYLGDTAIALYGREFYNK
jgi:hypothetical protein